MYSRFIILLITFLLPTLLLSQRGTIAGHVYDKESGAPLIGATVQVDSTTLGASTDLNGFYEITNIPTGSYNLTATYLGYSPGTKYNVVIRSAGNPDIVFNLQEEGVNIETVVVRPDPFVRDKESPNSIQKLSTEEIVAFPGGNNDIAKVVQILPGVSTSIAGFRNDIIIRGGAPNEVVYYLDGIEIPNINHFSTQGSGGGPVSLLNVSFFEGVTLNTGAFPARYDNALSGVLQFDQRTGNTRDMRRNLRISGSEAALTLEGPLFKGDKEESNTSYIVSARRSYLQLLFKLLDLPFLPDYWDFQTKVTHKIDDRNTLNFISVGSIDDFAINVPDDLTREGAAQLDQVPVIKQWSYTGGVSWRHNFKNRKAFSLLALSVNTLDNSFKRYEDNEAQQGLFLSNESRETEYKLRYGYTVYANQVKIEFGLLGQYARYENQFNLAFDDTEILSEIDFAKYGIYAQLSRSYLDNRLNVSAGLRVDGNTFTEQGNEVWRTLSPRLSVSYQLDQLDHWRVNASFGRYTKLPPYTVLGYRNNAGILANQNAAYIQSTQVVAGAEYLPRSSTKISIEGFYKAYENYPVSVSQGVSLANLGADFEVFGNELVRFIGKGRSYGLEISAQQKLSNNFFGILSMTFFRSEYTSLNDETYLPAIWDSSPLISFSGGYKLGRNWEVGAKLRYAGRSPYAPVDVSRSEETYPDLVLDYSALGDNRLPPFSTLDIRVDKKWNFNRWSLDVFIDLQNVYGADAVQPPVYAPALDANGNEVNPVNLVEVMDIDAGQILPTLGIIIDW